MSRSSLKRNFLRWHRSLGISSAVFVLLLTITGVLLNHSHGLGLDQRPIHSMLLLKLYGIQPQKLIAFSLPEGSVEQLGRQVFVNGLPVTECQGQLVAGVAMEIAWVLVCSEELLLVTPNADLIERISAAQGLPTPVESAGMCSGHLCFATSMGQFQADDDLLEFEPTSESFIAKPEVLVNEAIREKVLANRIDTDITWSRLIQDIHAGRFLGMIGPFIMDAVALMFLLLAASGVYLWSSKSKRK